MGLMVCKANKQHQSPPPKQLVIPHGLRGKPWAEFKATTRDLAYHSLKLFDHCISGHKDGINLSSVQFRMYQFAQGVESSTLNVSKKKEYAQESSSSDVIACNVLTRFFATCGASPLAAFEVSFIAYRLALHYREDFEVDAKAKMIEIPNCSENEEIAKMCTELLLIILQDINVENFALELQKERQIFEILDLVAFYAFYLSQEKTTFENKGLNMSEEFLLNEDWLTEIQKLCGQLK
jgi:hypothetical protein